MTCIRAPQAWTNVFAERARWRWSALPSRAAGGLSEPRQTPNLTTTTARIEHGDGKRRLQAKGGRRPPPQAPHPSGRRPPAFRRTARGFEFHASLRRAAAGAAGRVRAPPQRCSKGVCCISAASRAVSARRTHSTCAVRRGVAASCVRCTAARYLARWLGACSWRAATCAVGARLLQPPATGRARQKGVGAAGHVALRSPALLRVLPKQQDQQCGAQPCTQPTGKRAWFGYADANSLLSGRHADNYRQGVR